MKKTFKIIFLFLLLPISIKATTQTLSVVINEIAWMGTKANSADEWIELYNNTDQDIDLSNWGLYEEETLIERLNNVIKAKSYYLIERTDESTIKNVESSQEPSSWSGYGLNNNGENIKLINQNFEVIDEVNCSEGWFAGTKESFKTMERIDPQLSGSNKDNWKNNSSSSNALDAKGNIINGTPKTENSKKIEVLKEKINYSSNIIINEILPYPEGPDNENEWIELKNTGEQDVSLYNWKLEDVKGATSSYVFLEGTIIQANSFLVLERPTTKITLNNDEDGLKLISPDKKIISLVNYTKANLGKSYSIIGSEWFWNTDLSPNQKNKIIEKEKIEEDSIINIQEDQKIKAINKKNINNSEKELIFVDKKEFIFIFLKAILISLISSFFVLTLKKRLKEEFDFRKKIS